MAGQQVARFAATGRGIIINVTVEMRHAPFPQLVKIRGSLDARPGQISFADAHGDPLTFD
jgi:hypothetical protein